MSSTASRIGGGLVEISAVATIIGAPIAEALIHGLKGACGMVWAPMSTFGAIHVTKACLSASVPDWLREAMGLSNPIVTNAIGVMLPITLSKQSKNRVDLGDAKAVQVASPRSREKFVDGTGRGTTNTRRRLVPAQLEQGTERAFLEEPSKWFEKRAMCVYTLDLSFNLVLDTVQAADRGEPVSIHRFMPDMSNVYVAWKDWTVLLMSLMKISESFCLWRAGSDSLWYWTMVGWFHAFVAALIIQMSGLGRDHALRPAKDIVAGVLPTPFHLGGQGKLILGVPSNVRRHPVWRTLLAMGAIFNASALFGIFISLNQEPATIVYVWVGFQVLWLAARTLVYYFVEGAAAAKQGVIDGKRWEDSDNEDRHRAMTLLSELSKHQVSSHPRGAYAYRDDCLSFHDLSARFNQTKWTLIPYLPGGIFSNELESIEIKAVAGDTLIRSAVWFTGIKLNNSELYDVAVAFIALEKQILAIPCIRVFACNCFQTRSREPDDAHTSCAKLEWLYFIPAKTDAGECWTYAHGSRAVGLLGCEVLTNEELHSLLAAKRWKISLQSCEELRAVLAVSRDACSLVINLLKPAWKEPAKKRAEEKVGSLPSKTPTIEVQELR